MKLLYCPDCHSVFNLDYHLKACECGKTKGKYDDNVEATVNGHGYSLAIGNGAFQNALMNLRHSGHASHDRSWYVDNCKVTHVWLRPHCGTGNPHVTVKEDL